MFQPSKSRKEREKENLPIIAELAQYQSPADVPSKFLCEKYGITQQRLAALQRSVFHRPLASNTSKEVSGSNEAKRTPGIGNGGGALARSHLPAQQRATTWQDPIWYPYPTSLTPGPSSDARARTQDVIERREVLEPEVSRYPRPSSDGEQPPRFFRGFKIVKIDPQPLEEETDPDNAPILLSRVEECKNALDEALYEKSMFELESVRDFYAEKRDKLRRPRKKMSHEEVLKMVAEIQEASAMGERERSDQALMTALMCSIMMRKCR